MNSDHQCHSNS